MNSLTQKHGFTLVEIMLVVAVIGILTMIAIPKVINVVNKARRSQAEADLNVIVAALGQLTSDTGVLPSVAGQGIQYISDSYGSIGQEVEDLSTPDAGLMACATNRFGTKWQGPYLDKMPIDPWGHKYFLDPDYNVGVANATKSVGELVFGGGGKFGVQVTRSILGSYGPNGKGLNNYDSDDIYIILK